MARRRRAREFYVIIEEGEDGYYVAEVPQLRGCYTQAKTLDELMARVKQERASARFHLLSRRIHPPAH